MIVATRLCPYMTVPRHVCAHTRLCPDTCLAINVCGHKRVWSQICLGSHVWAQSCGHNHVKAQLCLGSNVFGHKLTCVGTNVSWHSHVITVDWAQSAFGLLHAHSFTEYGRIHTKRGTSVPSERRVGASSPHQSFLAYTPNVKIRTSQL